MVWFQCNQCNEKCVCYFKHCALFCCHNRNCPKSRTAKPLEGIIEIAMPGDCGRSRRTYAQLTDDRAEYYFYVPPELLSNATIIKVLCFEHFRGQDPVLHVEIRTAGREPWVKQLPMVERLRENDRSIYYDV